MENSENPIADEPSNEADPFEKFKICENWKLLKGINGRAPCPKCRKSRKYFCYSCYIPLPVIRDLIPRVKLPITLEIIKHKKEMDGKSTSAHAAILSPDFVTIREYPDIPDYSQEDLKRMVLIYPSTDAADVSYLRNSAHSVRKVVFIDGTWVQSKAMSNAFISKGLKCVKLQRRITQFWRHQKGSPRWYLSTIEAIHEFMVEFHEIKHQSHYEGEYDDLLFFFRHMYELIHSYYDHEKLLSYRRPM